jgi:hypothetical protein
MNFENIYVKSIKNEKIVNLKFEGFVVYLYLISFVILWK